MLPTVNMFLAVALTFAVQQAPTPDKQIVVKALRAVLAEIPSEKLTKPKFGMTLTGDETYLATVARETGLEFGQLHRITWCGAVIQKDRVQCAAGETTAFFHVDWIIQKDNGEVVVRINYARPDPAFRSGVGSSFFDVRLSKENGSWKVTAVQSAGLG